MVNNEFHLIGIATSNFEKINKDSRSKFIAWQFKIEIEKQKSKSGSNFEVTIIVYDTNRAINVDDQLIGKTIAVNGYIDSFATEKGMLVTKLVAQNLFVIYKGVLKQSLSHEYAKEVAKIGKSEVDGELPF